MGKTFRPDAAEREANEIAFRFQNSNDVMGDMSRAYHVDFSNIKIHTDGAADSKVKAAGKDALAKGNDLFFGKGIFESNDPGSKGLLAHELAHTMQQGAAEGGEGAVSEMAPMGAEQGGRIRDWFKGLFGGKKEPEMEISEPTLADDPTAPGFRGYQTHHSGSSDDQSRTFMSSQSRAIYQMVQNATPEQLRTDPKLRELILNDYKTNMSKRLQNYEDKSYMSTFSEVFRSSGAGELKTLNMLLDANMPENLVFQMGDIYDGTQGSVGAMLQHGAEQIGENDDLMEILQEGMKGFAGSSHFTGENAHRQSEMMMNNLMLRYMGPKLGTFQGDQDKRKKYQQASIAMQKEANLGKSAGAGFFRRLLDGFRV